MYLKNNNNDFQYNKLRNFGKNITNKIKKNNSKINISYKNIKNNKSTQQIVIYCKRKAKLINEFAFTSDIYNYFNKRKIENNNIESYLEKQVDINLSLRKKLFKWIIDVNFFYKMSVETLFMTFQLIDDYTTKFLIERKNYQLLGATCLFISSKFHEIYPPKLDSFIFICDDIYEKSQFIKMESIILLSKNFILLNPNHLDLLNIKWLKNNLDKKNYNKAKYYLIILHFNINFLNENIEISIDNIIDLVYNNKRNYIEFILNFEIKNNSFINNLKKKLLLFN